MKLVRGKTYIHVIHTHRKLYKREIYIVSKTLLYILDAHVPPFSKKGL